MKRDCASCIHFVSKENTSGCELWECEYKGKSNRQQNTKAGCDCAIGSRQPAESEEK